MLKFLFWTLLLANGVLFAYHQGYMQTLAPEGREPGRAAQQLNADKVKLVPAAAVEPAPAGPADAAPAEMAPAAPAEPLLQSVSAAGGKPAEPAACVEVGNFDAAEAKRFEARIASLALGKRVSQHPVADGMRHRVFIPSQGSKEGADKKADELRRLGVDDFYVIQDDNAMRWGISLGIFRSEEAARSHLAGLNRKGVRSARLGPYSGTSARLAFRLRGLDASARDGLERIGKEFPQQQVRACESAQPST